MPAIEVILNGKRVWAVTGITILDLAKQHGIEIPTLCHDDELKPYGSCWVCAVEVKGRRGFVTSCGTYLTDGMEIITDSPDIHQARKMALELLVSDHYADCEAPCKIACPNEVDIQSYISLIANGQFHEAIKVIKDKLPMPLSIGRVCPAFCERECRRQLVEEPVAIRQLKRYAADMDLQDYWNYIPEKLPTKDHKVAVIGAGPSGLTCGFYLSNLGYGVDVFEMEAAAGGWLRYGIPEYRLPKEILEKEIQLMCANGMKIHYNQKMGRDISLTQLCKDYAAVYVAIGAQKAVPMPVPGSDLEGCYLGVDFLKAHVLGMTPHLGKRVAIVGGGNTAIDCARTAVRLGCEVTIIYRRTKEEMPAEPFEIVAAEHEGVRFFMLSNPVEYLGENGKLSKVKIEKMRLGEPDSSGRRRPEPTGDYFITPFDSIIAAISQVPDTEALSMPENYLENQIFPLSRWSTAIADEQTMFTGKANVFAGGDFRRGAATAIEAIADGRRAAEMIDKFIQGKPVSAERPRFDSKKGRKVKEISIAEYEQFDQRTRQPMPEIELEKALCTFQEVELGYADNQAKTEAERCLECGCQVNETCFLRKYATDYKVDPVRFFGSINRHPIDASHPFILRDANKCINCGRCIRTCAEIQGAAVLGYIYRGFPTLVAPEFGESLTETSCESCGKCVNVCPVGALLEQNMTYKMNPLPKEYIIQSCGLCGTGCTVKVETVTSAVTRITTPSEEDTEGLMNNAFNGRNICFYGRFGWQALFSKDKLCQPMLRENSGYKPITWDEAAAVISGRAAAAKTLRFELSPFVTLEEMLFIKNAALNLNAILTGDNYPGLFSDPLWEVKPAMLPYAKMEDYKTFVVCGEISHTLRTMLRLQQRKGTRLILINSPESGLNRFADVVLDSLDELEPTADMLFFYNINCLSESDVHKLWQKATLVNTEATNLQPGSYYSNLGGYLSLGIEPNDDPADFILSYGHISRMKSNTTFMVAVVPFAEEGADADLLLPLPTYLEIEGTALANLGIVTQYLNPTRSELFNRLLKLGYDLNWINPALAEPLYWQQQAKQLLKTMAMHERVLFEELNIDTSALKPDAIPVQSETYRRMKELYYLRKVKQFGFPYQY